MARKATLIFDKLSFSAEFVKVDRKKLYGWSKIVVNDKDKNPCSSASIADCSHILPSKSTTLQGFNEKGEYISRSNLVGVDLDNNLVEKVPSTYDIDTELKHSTLDKYFSLNVKSVYQLNVIENKDKIINMFDQRFFRMWEFYLLASKYSFVNMGNVVFQIQIAKNINNLPLTRNYIYN